MMHKIIVSGLIVLVAGVSASAAPWWDDFPRMVDDSDVSTVISHHGNFAMNSNGTDPAWGTFFQANQISLRGSSIAAFQNAGLKQIYYTETYGQTISIVSELGAWNESSLTPVLHHFWNWQNYGGGTIRWLGAKNFFDDEVYARPYTRTHSRYGGLPMTYPDGTEATGYDGTDTDPRNSRVYDAACSKGILGEMHIDYIAPDGSQTAGLVNGAGHMSFGKDAACPLWTNYTYASTLQSADAGVDGMWTDNYGPWDSFGSEAIRHAFGDWSVARFRTYLADNFTWLELAGMGVSDVSTFDIREHLKSVASGWASWGNNLSHSVWSDSRWLTDDSLWRAYLIFKRQTGTEALSNYYATVKSAALEGGKPEFLVAGNDIPIFSLGWCRGDLDMVSTELGMGWQLSNGTTGFKPPPTGRFAPLYKLAREHAKSRFVNVWLYNDGYVSELSNPELVKVMYYEMLSTHTFPKVDPGSGHVAGDTTTDSDFFGFVEQAAPVYGDRVPVEDIGIYYSSSSVLRQMTPGGFDDHAAQPHQFSFWGWGTALGELHYQYRAIPEWKLTTEMLATLRLLVIPNADVFDPSDIPLLQTWVNGGGRLIITGNIGAYLSESDNFDQNPNPTPMNILIGHDNVDWISGNIGMDYYLAYENRPASLSQFSSAVDTALAGAAPGGVMATDASSRTGITLYEDELTGTFFIDVNNFNIDLNTYAVTGTGAVTIEALLPEGLRGKTLQVSVVSPQASTPAVALLTPADADHVKVSLDSVDYYAGIVISTVGNEWFDPVASGYWDVASNWIPASVPDSSRLVLWRYDSNYPAITIVAPAEAAGFTAHRLDQVASYWNFAEGGLRIVNHGAHTGSLTIGGGSGLLDMWDGGWFGSRLTVVNEDEAAAANIVNAGTIKVRDLLVDTSGIPSGKSYFTHEEGALEIMVQIELGGFGAVGDESVFRQSGGTLTVVHDALGLELGEDSAGKGTFILDGGTSSISTITFAGPDSLFEFNNGTFQSGARDVVWKSWEGGTPAGTLQLAETGEHVFDVAAGQTMTINAEIQLTDKPSEKGTLIKTGEGTLALDTASSNSGLMDIQEGVLSLSTIGLDPELSLLVHPASAVVLGFVGTNMVSGLSLDGGATWEAFGAWGALGSGVEHESNRFTGTGRLLVTGRVPPFSWAEIYFTEAEIATGLAVGDQDLDGDGMNNLAEYALGGNPRTDDAAAVLPVAEFTLDSMTYVYNRRRDATSRGLHYGLSFKLDISSVGGWTYVGTGWEKGSELINADFEAVTNEVTIAELDRAFFRLEISAD